jgi:hypothetical protein
VALATLGFFSTSRCQNQDGVANESLLEKRIVIAFQSEYEGRIQKIYKMYHPWGGKPTAIAVTSATITKWKNGVATGEGDNISQFDVNYTILWSSLLHPNATGHTDARSTYQVADGQVKNVGNRIINTNGTHTVDNEGQDMMSLAKVLILVK